MKNVLGILNVKELDEDTIRRLEELESYDLSYITKNLVDEGIFPPEQIYPIKMYFGRADLQVSKKLELEFKRYIALKLIYRELSFTPSRFVDMYWHLFILYTREYREFCVNLYGKILNHVPFEVEFSGEESTNGKEMGPYEYTRTVYSEIFGSLDKKMWPDIEHIIRLYQKKRLTF